ncbi:MAG TPA: cation:proton antiporter, partial [Pirellulales bacterium]|nr:cation:proton antiporter [Pirellulales bacterium]
FALLALSFKYSVALGAFLAGTLVAESGRGKQIEHLVAPVRDLFAAVFFVAVGMMINPSLILEYWRAVVLFTLLVIVGKVLAVSLSAFLTGFDTRTSAKAGMSLAQIGEFSFIIAGLGLSTGATREFLYPLAVAVSAITTLTTPWLIRLSDPASRFIDRKLPRPLQTFASLYGSWIEQLRLAPHDMSETARLRRWVRMLLLDFVIVAAIVIGVSTQADRLTAVVTRWTGFERPANVLLALAMAAVVLAPFAIGIIRNARGLGQALALRVLPAAGEGTLDLGLAPRRALVVTLQLAIVLLLGAPLVAVTQPFLPPFQGAAILLIVLLGLGMNFWRSATNLQGHARAAAQTIVELLARQANTNTSTSDSAAAIDQLHHVLPGLGSPEPLLVATESPAVGKKLSELALRSLTGATILGITRGDQQIVVPSGDERIEAGDVLAVAGSHDAVAAARAMITGGTLSTA